MPTDTPDVDVGSEDTAAPTEPTPPPQAKMELLSDTKAAPKSEPSKKSDTPASKPFSMPKMPDKDAYKCYMAMVKDAMKIAEGLVSILNDGLKENFNTDISKVKSDAMDAFKNGVNSLFQGVKDLVSNAMKTSESGVETPQDARENTDDATVASTDVAEDRDDEALSDAEGMDDEEGLRM